MRLTWTWTSKISERLSAMTMYNHAYYLLNFFNSNHLSGGYTKAAQLKPT